MLWIRILWIRNYRTWIPGPDSFFQRFEETEGKVQYFLIFVDLLKVRKDTIPAGSVNGWPPGSGSGSGFVIQYYGSVDPDPKEIFTDPKNCLKKGLND